LIWINIPDQAWLLMPVMPIYSAMRYTFLVAEIRGDSEMIEAFLVLALSQFNVPHKTANIQPCVWPRCVKPVEVATIQPCVWPRCSKAQPLVASLGETDVESCVWPKKCASGATF